MKPSLNLHSLFPTWCRSQVGPEPEGGVVADRGGHLVVLHDDPHLLLHRQPRRLPHRRAHGHAHRVRGGPRRPEPDLLRHARRRLHHDILQVLEFTVSHDSLSLFTFTEARIDSLRMIRFTISQVHRSSAKLTLTVFAKTSVPK